MTTTVQELVKDLIKHRPHARVREPKPDLGKDLQSLIDKIQCIVDSPEYANVEDYYGMIRWELSGALDAAKRALDDNAR